jgi:S-adenosylmethionine:tRNA ribosyltransferase-isomerase
MEIRELGYALSPRNVVGTPRELRLGRRDLGRMLVVERATGAISDSSVMSLTDWLQPGDVVILNNSKRIPGVLHGRTESGGKVELRFVDLDLEGGAALCRIFPMHDVVAGSTIRLRGGGTVQVDQMHLTRYDLARVSSRDGSVRLLLRQQGTPILGFFYDGLWQADHLNPYYAEIEGSVESPLAGLHFTRELVASLAQTGIEVCFVTLHSVGSWLPFLEERAEEHEMWAEYFSIPDITAARLNAARTEGRRVVAVGSTSLRAIESAVGDDGMVSPGEGRTTLYAFPGFPFRVTDAFFTNFHQQQTSLIVLDCAFAGQDVVMKAYHSAAERGYEFYEFGDAVLYL